MRSISTENYAPTYCPWHEAEFTNRYLEIQNYTLVGKERCYILATLAEQALKLSGEYWECGVYKGGTAMLLNKITRCVRPLRLFDTFEGMPETSDKDWHQQGSFADTSLEAVQSRISNQTVDFRKGFIPDTFKGLEKSDIAFAHIDVDIYPSVKACLEFIMPRLLTGGFIVIDDYGFSECAGAKDAVDEFFSYLFWKPLVLSTGQALIIKN